MTPAQLRAVLPVLRELADSAASDVREYLTPGGTFVTVDDFRVGRMLARDPLIARVLPDVVDAASALLDLREACERLTDAVARGADGSVLASELRDVRRVIDRGLP